MSKGIIATANTGGNLHHQWDQTKFSLTDPAVINGLASQAKRIGITDGSYETWATQWAGDTIVVAQQAFDGLAFNAKADKAWRPVNFDDRRSYIRQMSVIQRQQVIKAGGRLAKLLKTIWPD